MNRTKLFYLGDLAPRRHSLSWNPASGLCRVSKWFVLNFVEVASPLHDVTQARNSPAVQLSSEWEGAWFDENLWKNVDFGVGLVVTFLVEQPPRLGLKTFWHASRVTSSPEITDIIHLPAEFWFCLVIRTERLYNRTAVSCAMREHSSKFGESSTHWNEYWIHCHMEALYGGTTIYINWISMLPTEPLQSNWRPRHFRNHAQMQK